MASDPTKVTVKDRVTEEVLKGFIESADVLKNKLGGEFLLRPEQIAYTHMAMQFRVASLTDGINFVPVLTMTLGGGKQMSNIIANYGAI